MAANGKHYFHNGHLMAPPKPKAPEAKAPEPKVAKLGGDTAGYPQQSANPLMASCDLGGGANPMVFKLEAPAPAVPAAPVPQMES